MRVAHHRKQFLDVNEPNRVIEILPAERETCVLGIDGLFHVGLEVVLEVKINDFTARRHDIAHDAVAQVEHVKDKFTTERRNLGGLFAFPNNQSQLLLAMGQFSFGNGFYMKKAPKNPIARGVKEPDC